MEGAYNKVLDARPHVPDPSYGYFMEKLLSTVRLAYVVLTCASILRNLRNLRNKRYMPVQGM
jgi:hypothetical protein